MSAKRQDRKHSARTETKHGPPPMDDRRTFSPAQYQAMDDAFKRAMLEARAAGLESFIEGICVTPGTESPRRAAAPSTVVPRMSALGEFSDVGA